MVCDIVTAWATSAVSSHNIHSVPAGDTGCFDMQVVDWSVVVKIYQSMDIFTAHVEVTVEYDSTAV